MIIAVAVSNDRMLEVSLWFSGKQNKVTSVIAFG
jgi:hypothetical protein